MVVRAAGALSIGALSAATGIPVETIRTWERRYGFPRAERKPSGHRVYPVATVARLRLIQQALERGARAADVVSASERALEELLSAWPDQPPAVSDTTRALPASSADTNNDLLDAVRAFDAERLKQSFQAEWARRGPLAFLEQRAAPFLRTIGDAWESGELDVRHEHFASASLGDFLRNVRAPLDDRAQGRMAALATLAGERHGLGLQMCALVFALAGWRALVLGTDTPADQIIGLVKEAPISAVAVSMIASEASDIAQLRSLRRRLPAHIPILVGGAAATHIKKSKGIDVMPDLASLDRWLQRRVRA
jgi:DNA-binding transcriptional MerR regulator